MKQYLAILALILPAMATAEFIGSKENRWDILETKKRCIYERNQMSAAADARDWNSLKRIANKYIDNCNNVLGLGDVSKGYASLGMAYLNLNEFSRALNASEMCIETNYTDSLCHVNKADALYNLNRLNEANDALDVAERISRHSLDQAKIHREAANSQIDKELHDSEIRFEKNMLATINIIRSRLDE